LKHPTSSGIGRNRLLPVLNSAEAQFIGVAQEIEKICVLRCHALDVR
jgi:hypothetical protein